jgi:hypothetical protein
MLHRTRKRFLSYGLLIRGRSANRGAIASRSCAVANMKGILRLDNSSAIGSDRSPAKSTSRIALRGYRTGGAPRECRSRCARASARCPPVRLLDGFHCRVDQAASPPTSRSYSSSDRSELGCGNGVGNSRNLDRRSRAGADDMHRELVARGNCFDECRPILLQHRTLGLGIQHVAQRCRRVKKLTSE